MYFIKLIVKHVIYRFLRYWFIVLQNLWFTLNGSKLNAKTLRRPLEVGKIVYRFKLSPADVSTGYNFVWYHDEYQEEDCLRQDPHWSLYAVDRKYVHFVYLPKVEKCYNSTAAPFMYAEQYKDALKIASMELNRFVEFTQRLATDHCNVVFLSSAARSGSTLVSKMLQCSDNITVYSEPEFFTLLSIFEQNAILSRDLCGQLVSGGIRYMCRHFGADETLVVKPRSTVIHLVPLINEMLPKVKHVYVFRKDFRKILLSIYKMLLSDGGTNVRGQIRSLSVRLCEWMFTELLSYGFMNVYKQFYVNSTMSTSIALYVINYVIYWQNRNCFSIPWLLYEDLMKDPTEALKPLFELCKLPTDRLAVAIQALNHDSQSGTTLSRSRLNSIKVDKTLTDEDMKLIHYICETSGVPDIFYN